MSIRPEFQEMVEKKEIRKVRILLKNELRVDPTFRKFDEMETYAREKLGDELYEPFDGKELNEDEDSWDDAYMNQVLVDLVNNFSHKRIRHAKHVVSKLRGKSEREVERDIEDICKARSREGAVIGGAVGVAVGLIASASAGVVVATTIAGVCVGAAIGYHSVDKGE